ncbi:MAG: hypothetical protein ACKVT0_23130 [Planctomycetaceae bacterium]
MIQLGRILAGIPLTFLVLLVFTGGDVQNAVAVFVLSIICTAGIGLIFWLPVMWVVGTLTLMVYEAAAQAYRDRSGTSSQPQTSTQRGKAQRKPSDIKALADYLKKFQTYGDIQDAIKRLRLQGWSDKQIEQAIELADT